MKTNLTTLLSMTLLFSIMLFGCKKEDGGDEGTCSDGIQNQTETGVDCGGPCPACAPSLSPKMSAKVDGNSWAANYIQGSVMGGKLVIQGSFTSTPEAIQLTHDGEYKTGSYDLSYFDGNYSIGTSNYIIDDGTITFSTFNTQWKYVSGTFNFTATDASSGKSVTVTNGVFQDISY